MICFISDHRESIYRLLPQTTPENVSKNFSRYSVDPTTRYPNISLNFLRPNQVGTENTDPSPSFSSDACISSFMNYFVFFWSGINNLCNCEHGRSQPL